MNVSRTQFLKYFNYLANHFQNVVDAWIDIRDLLIEKEIITKEEERIIDKLIIFHDESKINPDEFEAYANYYYPEGKNDQESFKKAWETHKSKNLHHHQTLKDYVGSDWKCHIISMICDWMAMGKEFGDTAYSYYLKEKNSIELPDEYREFLENTLNVINSRNNKLSQAQKTNN